MLKYYKTLYSARKYGLLGYNIRDMLAYHARDTLVSHS